MGYSLEGALEDFIAEANRIEPMVTPTPLPAPVESDEDSGIPDAAWDPPTTPIPVAVGVTRRAFYGGIVAAGVVSAAIAMAVLRVVATHRPEPPAAPAIASAPAMPRVEQLAAAPIREQPAPSRPVKRARAKPTRRLDWLDPFPR